MSRETVSVHDTLQKNVFRARALGLIGLVGPNQDFADIGQVNRAQNCRNSDVYIVIWTRHAGINGIGLVIEVITQPLANT